MRLVEAIAGKFFHQIENLNRETAVYPLRSGTLFKYLALPFHLFGIFLSHGTTQHIGTTERVTCKYLGDLHHLFLVENNTVGGLQNGL